jgi:hypothetical protein
LLLVSEPSVPQLPENVAGSESRVVVAIRSEICRRIHRFLDSELLIIVADKADKGYAVASKAARSETAGTTASSGKLWQCASGADVDGQGADATKLAMATRQRWASQFQMWIPILTIWIQSKR